MTKKILVIDDHPETVRLIEMTLRRHGYEVFGAQSGEKGIALAKEHLPNLILLDVMMPDMDGLTVCRIIREQDNLRHLPIVMFTAKTQVQDKRAGFEAGADDYLTKPTRPAELISRVEAILARAEAQETESSQIERLPRADLVTAVEPAMEKEDQALIAVLGARGGAGATTVAINLAVSIADEGYATTLIDLDTRQGHVAVYLGHDVQQDVAMLLQQAPTSLPSTFNRYLVRQGERLSLLLANPRLGQQENGLQTEQVAALSRTLRGRNECVVVDLGHHSGRNIYPLLQEASHILICLRPERAAIMATKYLVERFGQMLSHPEKMHALMLNFGLADNLPRRSVENYLGFPLLDVLKITPSAIAEAVNHNRPLVHVHPQDAAGEQFRKLAQQMVLE